jgi:hypothetical protein
VELTRRRLPEAFSLPAAEARLRPVPKTVIHFIAEYGPAGMDKRWKGLAAGLLERWWCWWREAGIGTFPQWARHRYLPPERDASWVG